MSEGGLVKIGPYSKELAKMIKDSSSIRRIAQQLDYVFKPYKWPPHKLVASKPIPTKFDRALYPKMHLNLEEERFAVFLNKIGNDLELFWLRNDPSDVKIFKGHAPDFIMFNEYIYVFLEFKGKHILHSSDSLRKNESGQAAAGYFMVYEEEDTGRFISKGRVGEPDEEFTASLLKSAIPGFKEKKLG